MTSLDFLYIALGSGFLLLMVFLSVLVLHLTILLRDVSKITGDVSEVTSKVKETVFEPLKALSELTAGFGFINDIVEKVRSKYEENAQNMEEEEDEPVKKSETKSKNGFFTKKLNK